MQLLIVPIRAAFDSERDNLGVPPLPSSLLEEWNGFLALDPPSSRLPSLRALLHRALSVLSVLSLLSALYGTMPPNMDWKSPMNSASLCARLERCGEGNATSESRHTRRTAVIACNAAHVDERPEFWGE